MSGYVPLPLLYLGFIELLGCASIFLSKNISFGGYETHILQFRLPCQVQLTGSDYLECCGGDILSLCGPRHECRKLLEMPAIMPGENGGMCISICHLHSRRQVGHNTFSPGLFA